MKKIVILTLFLLTINMFGQVGVQWYGGSSDTIYKNYGKIGIGTTNPDLLLEVVGGLALPNTTVPINGNAVFSDGGNIGLVFGVLPSPYGGWIQARNIGIANIGYTLAINPTGGNVGVGTTSPTEKLEINGNFKLSGGTLRAIFLGDQGYLRSGQSSGDWVHIEAQNAPGLALNHFSSAKVAIATGGGNVGIGTLSPDQKLTVNGNIHAKEIIVNTSIPDYVFEPNYDLLPLNQVKKYIQDNGHLPDVPSQKTVEVTGVSLGEFNRILLQKIEELTLYTIDLDQELKAMKETIKLLETKIQGLE